VNLSADELARVAARLAGEEHAPGVGVLEREGHLARARASRQCAARPDARFVERNLATVSEVPTAL
jgi:hypothetical protein